MFEEEATMKDWKHQSHSVRISEKDLKNPTNIGEFLGRKLVESAKYFIEKGILRNKKEVKEYLDGKRPGRSASGRR